MFRGSRTSVPFVHPSIEPYNCSKIQPKSFLGPDVTGAPRAASPRGGCAGSCRRHEGHRSGNAFCRPPVAPMAGGLADAAPGGGMNGSGKADAGGYGGGELLIPPLNFAMVTPGVYRSGAFRGSCSRGWWGGGGGVWKELDGCLWDVPRLFFCFSGFGVELGL